jgi:ribosomal protein S18 acetylase RimI-like enzyme
MQDLELLSIEAGSVDHTRMVDLRDRVLRRPLGRTLSTQDTERDATADLLVARQRGQVVGSCLLTVEGPTLFQLRAMAIEPELQRQGVGRALVAFAEARARDRGAVEILLEARVTALGFYGSLGYVAEGEEFLKVGLPHQRMRKRLGT